MAQVAQQDPSTTAPKERSISVDDTALTQPLVPEHIPTYQRLHGDSLAYPTHQIVDRSHATKPSSRTMQSSRSPKHQQQGPPSQSQRDPDRLPNSSSLQSSASIPPDRPHSKSDSRPNKPVPLPEQGPSGRVDDPQSTSSLHREVRPSAADFVATSSSPTADQQNASFANDSHTPPNSDPSPSETATATSADNTQSHASPAESVHNPSVEQHPAQPYLESSEASPAPPVPLDQFQGNHPMYNMVATFGEMTINPMQYGPSVPMISMQPHPIPLSPEQAAHVAHQHRQHHMFHHQPQTYYLWVPQERVGAVIGGHGTVIRSLQERSGATIQVHNEKVQGDHKLFTIYGTRAQYEAAAKLVNEIVARPRSSAPSAHSASSDRSHYSNLGDHNAKATEMCKTVYVPSRCVGLVIGRNGETIRNLQDKSGAIIKVTRNEEATPGAENRSILISGTEEAITQAHQLVSEIVMEARVRRPYHLGPVGPSPGGQPAVVEVLAIPNDKVGLIIGKKGATIKDLQMKSGAKIQVTKDDNCLQTDGSRPVTISGNRSDVDDAKAMIASKINVQMLPPIPGAGAFPGGARAALPPQTAGQAMPFLIPPHVYEHGFQNGQESFSPFFEAGDMNNPGRAAMAYFQYMGYSNYHGAGQHGRGFQHPMPMQYGPPQQQQQQIQEQQVMQAAQPDQQDPSVQQSFHSPNVKPGQPMELPGSPPLLSRDANGGIFMYQGHPFQQMAQMPTQNQMFPPPPNSRMFSHREQAHVAHVQAQAQAQAQLLAHAQAHAHAQIAQTRSAGSAAQPQAMPATPPPVQTPTPSDAPPQVHSHEDDSQTQQANVIEGEQSS